MGSRSRHISKIRGQKLTGNLLSLVNHHDKLLKAFDNYITLLEKKLIEKQVLTQTEIEQLGEASVEDIK